MPANRRRTEHWRRSLWQVYERGGALEISLRHPSESVDRTVDSAEPTATDRPFDLVWRVKLLNLSDDEITIETPTTLGQSVVLDPGAELICVLAIGQNRWMFSARVLGHVEQRTRHDRSLTALRLEMPRHVERCQRRSFNRVSTLEIRLPSVTCWPLLDPRSAAVAEKANEVQIRDALEGKSAGRARADTTLTLPEVGPPFAATLANVGGGGVGLIVEPESAQSLTRHRTFWLRIALPPAIPTPLAVTARLVHTHMDSSQRTYAGFAFEFSHNRSHQSFVVEQLTRYVSLQLRRQAEEQGLRKAS